MSVLGAASLKRQYDVPPAGAAPGRRHIAELLQADAAQFEDLLARVGA